MAAAHVANQRSGDIAVPTPKVLKVNSMSERLLVFELVGKVKINAHHSPVLAGPHLYMRSRRAPSQQCFSPLADTAPITFTSLIYMCVVSRLIKHHRRRHNHRVLLEDADSWFYFSQMPTICRWSKPALNFFHIHSLIPITFSTNPSSARTSHMLT